MKLLGLVERCHRPRLLGPKRFLFPPCGKFTKCSLLARQIWSLLVLAINALLACRLANARKDHYSIPLMLYCVNNGKFVSTKIAECLSYELNWEQEGERVCCDVLFYGRKTSPAEGTFLFVCRMYSAEFEKIEWPREITKHEVLATSSVPRLNLSFFTWLLQNPFEPNHLFSRYVAHTIQSEQHEIITKYSS